VFGIGRATRIYLAPGATDMRKGFEGLYGLVRDRLQCEPLSGHIFLFCNARRNRLKLIYWDGSGLWVCGKRLQGGCFHWPQVSPGEVKVSLTPGWATWKGHLAGFLFLWHYSERLYTYRIVAL
jgi:transposase